MAEPTSVTTIPAETSSFTYEAPPQPEASELAEFNDLLKSSISEISDEYKPEPTEAERPAETEPQETTAEPEVEATQEPEGHEKSPEVERGFAQLVQREVQLQQRESAIAASEAKYKALETELASLRAAVPSKDLIEKFDLSPSDALKALGKDPETVVRLMIAEQLHAKGQPVPEGLQKFVEKAQTAREIAELRAQIAERDRLANEQRVASAVQAGAREYVTKVDAKKMASLATIFKNDPELAHLELMGEIDRQASRNPNGQLTYEGAAAEAEKRLARLAKALMGSASTMPTTQAQGAKTTPQTKPIVKPPAKPLKPWETKNSDLNAALLEAEREFHKVEAAERAARR